MARTAQKTAIGYIPKKDSLDLSGLKEKVDLDACYKLEKDFWKKETQEIQNYFDEQVGEDLPAAIQQELKKLEQRVDTEL